MEIAVPLFDLASCNKPYMEAFHQAFAEVAESGCYILGPYVERFERELASACGSPHAVGVSSGADALLITLMALGVGPGDEVITSPFSYVHTAGCIQRVGAKPVFVDIERDTFTMKAADVAAVITPATKAILPVHLFGQTCEMDTLLELAKKHGLYVVEDADQAIGATYRGKMAGTMGDAGALSFYPTKNLSAMGDAGAMLVREKSLADKIRSMRVHGLDADYRVHTLGGNFRLDALHASQLSVKLPRLHADVQLRRAHAARYERKLEELQITTPIEGEYRFHTYSHYTVRVRGEGRDALAAHLQANGVECRVYYPRPLHLQPCFAELGYKEGDFPEAEKACQEVLGLPVFPGMTREQQDLVIESIREFFQAW